MGEIRTILVTGGAGYVGSHTAAELVRRNYHVVVFDNLQTGHLGAVPSQAQFVRGDLANLEQLDRIFLECKIDGIMHFAANTLPRESLKKPFLYMGEDVSNALNLLRAAVKYNVKRFVFSSTANLFSAYLGRPIKENDIIVPGSPYGESKHIIERILYWMDQTHGIRFACLRYFNAAGAALDASRGEDHRPEHHLIPVILQVALNQKDRLEVFGDDYDSPDGTCVRDYIHVIDLAQAHILCMHALEQKSCTYNLGNGRGYSVQAVVSAAQKVTGAKIPIKIGPRRDGDPAVLVADSSAIKHELGWEPQYADLETIVSTAWQWHRTHPHGYGTE